MAKRFDISTIINKKIHSLSVIKEGHPHVTSGGHMHRTISCACSCGVIKDFQLSSVLNGAIKSCGCHSRRMASIRMKRQVTHNKAGTPIFNTWSGIKKRCNNPNHKAYKYYGGRGITICDEWMGSFEAFYRDMGDKPSKDHSIDRRDNNKGYYKENCYWATKKEQARNQRNNVIIEYNGERKCLAEWAEIYNMKWRVLHHRIFIAKWDMDKCFSEPIISSCR